MPIGTKIIRISGAPAMGRPSIIKQLFNKLTGKNNNASIGATRYKVVKIYRNSGRKTVLAEGLTEDQAQRKVLNFPDSDKHIVIYNKMD